MPMVRVTDARECLFSPEHYQHVPRRHIIHIAFLRTDPGHTWLPSNVRSLFRTANQDVVGSCCELAALADAWVLVFSCSNPAHICFVFHGLLFWLLRVCVFAYFYYSELWFTGNNSDSWWQLYLHVRPRLDASLHGRLMWTQTNDCWSLISWLREPGVVGACRCVTYNITDWFIWK